MGRGPGGCQVSIPIVALTRALILTLSPSLRRTPHPDPGNRGRQIARERRAAVGVIHFNARMWVGKLAYRRMRRQVVYLQRCRREVLWQREADERQQAILSVQAAARRKVASRLNEDLA